MTAIDPGLAFWVGWAEHRGALAEDLNAGTAVIVLPEALQHALALPEELSITADPEAAREDGALLLAPGQPVLDQAAELVLAEGDSGALWTPWPGTSAPTTATLIEAAREHIPVDHGRIDPAGEPAAVYAPLLRVGVLLTYSLSLDLRFQEREEVWVDARTGLEVPDRVRRRMGPPGPRPRDARPELPADIPAALGVADDLVGARAVARQGLLSKHAEADRQRQVAMAGAYYHDALASVDRRRATASPERRAVLDAQREVIDVERSRRIAEIEATFTARHESRPYRVHQVFVPSLQVPVTVRRGSRVYPFTLSWLLDMAAFAPLRCPRCRATRPLVAGRQDLGCRACLTPPAPPPPPAAAPPAAAQPDHRPSCAAPPPPAPPAPRRRAPAAAGSAVPAPERRRPAGGRVRSSAGDGQPRRSARPGGLDAAGRRLADELWSAVRFGERWPRKGKGVAADSPLAASVRLYGHAGPARAVGLPDARAICDVSALTLDGLGPFIVTTGKLWTSDFELPFSLRWSLDGAKPVVAEVLPGFAAIGPRACGLAEAHPVARPLLSHAAPAPRHTLDPVASAVWQLATGSLGLPVVLRCLAAWWRVADEVECESPSTLAAATVRLVGGRAGVPKDRLPFPPGTDEKSVVASARLLNRHLHLTGDRLW